MDRQHPSGQVPYPPGHHQYQPYHRQAPRYHYPYGWPLPDYPAPRRRISRGEMVAFVLTATNLVMVSLLILANMWGTFFGNGWSALFLTFSLVLLILGIMTLSALALRTPERKNTLQGFAVFLVLVYVLVLAGDWVKLAGIKDDTPFAGAKRTELTSALGVDAFFLALAVTLLVQAFLLEAPPGRGPEAEEGEIESRYTITERAED